MAQRISIQFGANGEGTMTCQGLGTFPCLGQAGRAYPNDLTINVSDKERVHRSAEFGVDMPFALRIWGQRGIYIHEFPCSLRTNNGPSAGCIHLCAGDAEKVYEWVVGRTRVTIEYPWAGTIP